jgi:hypothetical protein
MAVSKLMEFTRRLDLDGGLLSHYTMAPTAAPTAAAPTPLPAAPFMGGLLSHHTMAPTAVPSIAHIPVTEVAEVVEAHMTFAVAFALSLTSMVAWGSWSNTAKAAARTPFPVFYFDFSIGTFLTALIAFGSPLNAWQMVRPVTSTGGEEATASHLASALAAGAIFNVANILLTTGIQVAGLAVAFPVGIGTALVLGTLLTFAIDSHGNRADLLFTGVALGFVAILCQVSEPGEW